MGKLNSWLQILEVKWAMKRNVQRHLFPSGDKLSLVTLEERLVQVLLEILTIEAEI
jgi:hypothetical protein